MKDYDFIDFGASTGGSIEFAKRKLGGTRGLGVDLSPKKVAAMKERGLDCILGDITALDMPDKCVRFVTISHVLEHLPDQATVEGALDSALRLAREFVYVQGPWFDADDYLNSLSLKLYWSDWPRGHPSHVTADDLRKILDRRQPMDYFIAGRGVIADSAHPAVHPVASPPDQHAYDSAAHPAKPHVAFTRPIFEEMVCGIKLDNSPAWEKLHKARGAVTMVVPPRARSSGERLVARPSELAMRTGIAQQTSAPPVSSQRTPLTSAAVPSAARFPTEPSATAPDHRRVHRSRPESVPRGHERRLTELHHRLLRVRKWSYLRYVHLRQGLLLAPEVTSVLSVGAGRGLAELALAVEFPDVQFEITDFPGTEPLPYARAEDLASAWKLPNVRFSQRDILVPQPRRHDMVVAVELLHHMQDDRRAAAELRAAAKSWVFALVPFTTGASRAGERMPVTTSQPLVGNRIGYDAEELARLFPAIESVRGCYWTDAGLRLRERLRDADDDEITATVADFVDQATGDVRDAVPVRDADAQGIWVLARP